MLRLSLSDENVPNGSAPEKVIVGDMNFVREKDGAESVRFAFEPFFAVLIFFPFPGKKPQDCNRC